MKKSKDTTRPENAAGSILFAARLTIAHYAAAAAAAAAGNARVPSSRHCRRRKRGITCVKPRWP